MVKMRTKSAPEMVTAWLRAVGKGEFDAQTCNVNDALVRQLESAGFSKDEADTYFKEFAENLEAENNWPLSSRMDCAAIKLYPDDINMVWHALTKFVAARLDPSSPIRQEFERPKNPLIWEP